MNKYHLLREQNDDCDGCEFWSVCCARAIGCSPMVARCLNPESIHYNKMVNAGCGLYSFGRPVDDPQ